MHCTCCNKILSDYEATRRHATTKEFIDMCNHCYGTISNEVLAIERQDLRHEDDDDLDGLLFEDNIKDFIILGKFDNEN